jgi:hypothetical protein
MLDQEPVGTFLIFSLAHPRQKPAAVKFFALQGKVQLAFFIRALWVVAVPMASIPNHDSATAILSLRNGAFKVTVIQRMVFDLDCEPPVNVAPTELKVPGPV